jgi:hypothetical protein
MTLSDVNPGNPYSKHARTVAVRMFAAIALSLAQRLPKVDDESDADQLFVLRCGCVARQHPRRWTK